MTEKYFYIGNIPAVLYGETSDKIYIFIHGKCGCKEEAADFARIAVSKGWQVLGIDLPGHGERKSKVQDFVPWKVVPELRLVMNYVRGNYDKVALRANSIGAYFAMLAYTDEKIERALFVSPILDMERLIKDMMLWAGITPEELRERGRIQTDFGEILDIEYFCYAAQNKVSPPYCPIYILYAGRDNMTDRKTVDVFVYEHRCRLSVFKDGEHWFHTPEQLEVLEAWCEKNV